MLECSLLLNELIYSSMIQTINSGINGLYVENRLVDINIEYGFIIISQKSEVIMIGETLLLLSYE